MASALMPSRIRINATTFAYPNLPGNPDSTHPKSALTSTRSPAHSYSSWRLLPVLDTDIAPSAPPLSSFSVSADGCRALPYPETQPSLWRSLGFVRRDLTFMARWPNGPPIHEHPTLHAADKHRWLPRPSKYRGRRHTKRASRLDWSRMGGRARVELRKTSQQAFPTRS